MKVVVIGSSTKDIVINVPKLPRVGETVLGHNYIFSNGGKGANQAMALARLGCNVTLISCVGTDLFGEQALLDYRKEGINTQFIIKEESLPSALAIVLSDSSGNNMIAVASQANQALKAEHVYKAKEIIKEADLLILQLSVNFHAIEEGIRLAKENNIPILLNPAPYRPSILKYLHNIHIITPNLLELSDLTNMPIDNMDNVKLAGKTLLALGIPIVIITLGSQGALVVTNKKISHIPAYRVTCVDETGAGDAFTAGLAVAYLEGNSLTKSTQFACAVGALTVTKFGAQTALPTRLEVDMFIHNNI